MKKIKKNKTNENYDWIFNRKKLLTKKEAEEMVKIIKKLRKEKFERNIINKINKR